MAMISWDGPGSQYRRSCAAYLQDVFELIDAAPGDPRVPVLDEIIHLLNPTAMRARMEHVPASYPRRDVLAERTRVSVSLLHAEPATTAELARQLRELRASAFGRWLRPSGPGPAGRDRPGPDGHRARRGPVPPRRRAAAAASAMLTRLVCQDLLAAGEALHRIDVDGDGIVWLTECGSMPRSSVTDLIARGPGTGLPVLAATTSGPVAAELAELTNVVVVYRMDEAAAPRSSRLGRAARGRVPARGQEPAAAGAARGLRPGPDPAARARRRPAREARMTSSRADRLYLGWQYATPHPEPGPPPRRPTPPEQERLSPDWAAAQRREENLLNRPLRAALGIAVVIGVAAVAPRDGRLAQHPGGRARRDHLRADRGRQRLRGLAGRAGAADADGRRAEPGRQAARGPGEPAVRLAGRARQAGPRMAGDAHRL